MSKIKQVLGLLNPATNRAELMRAGAATVAVAVLSFGVYAAAQQTSAVSLNVTVNTALTFTTSSNNFTTINPGTVQFATTTLVLSTNDVNGYNVTLYGGNKGTGTNNLQNGTYSIPDQTEWVPGAATTTVGNAVRQGSLTNGANVLAFRMMTASSTNGGPLISTSWWGTTDNYVDTASTLWAGISSTTVQRQIGNAGIGSYSASAHLNSVLYYLNVAPTQQTGTYTAPLTYTATGN